jgi:hypothetical protein
MTEPILRRAHVFAGIGHKEPARMAQHVGMNRRTECTIALLRTSFADVIASSVRDLSPLQRSALESTELAAKYFGAHAERTAIYTANLLARVFPGLLSPQFIITTWDVCEACAELIKASGGMYVDPRTYIFLQGGSP